MPQQGRAISNGRVGGLSQLCYAGISSQKCEHNPSRILSPVRNPTIDEKNILFDAINEARNEGKSGEGGGSSGMIFPEAKKSQFFWPPKSWERFWRPKKLAFCFFAAFRENASIILA